MDEIVDIVDEKNKLLYSTTKREAHEKGLLHRCVIGIVRNSRGDFVLVKQAPDRQDAGQYVAPVGGHVKSGESDVAALTRETIEEIGLSGFRHKFIGSFIFDRHVLNRQENHLMCVFEIYSDKPFILGGESVGYRAFTKRELMKGLATNRKEFGNAHLALVHHIYPELFAKHKPR